MDNNHEKESCERNKNSNTEYLPTKCRITRPPPPKPASNPLQFVKIGPPPLFKKAQEQIKKIEEIKKERKEIRDDTEEWQQNLDNWKSCRRKRQEHIIERVVEVKKLTEQEELEKLTKQRKSKTFSEMLEERSQKGRSKLSIPIYNDDDPNDLSDYGIGSSSSKTNSSKDADTDDSCSILDDKDNNQNLDIPPPQLSSSLSIQSPIINKDDDSSKLVYLSNNNNSNNNNNKSTGKSSTVIIKPKVPPKSLIHLDQRFSEGNNNINNNNNNVNNDNNNTKQYTYEGAIQDYRTRIKKKINVDESIFIRKEPSVTSTTINKSKEFSEAQSVLPKGEISKRKGLFESSSSSMLKTKSMMMLKMENNAQSENTSSSTTSNRRLSEDFVHAKSLKDRLKSLENASDQSLSKIEASNNNNESIHQVSVKERLANFNKQQNENINDLKHFEQPPPKPVKISSLLLLKKSESISNFENHHRIINNKTVDDDDDDDDDNENQLWTHNQEHKSSINTTTTTDAEIYMNKLDMFNRDLNTLMMGTTNHSKSTVDDNLSDYCTSGGSANYPPSTSSAELIGVLSDREDSGIHTADVSCSVSQADEPIDIDNDPNTIILLNNTIPNCIEKLKLNEKENTFQNHDDDDDDEPIIIINDEEDNNINPSTMTMTTTTEEDDERDIDDGLFTREEIIEFTKEFLANLIKDATEEIQIRALEEKQQQQQQQQQQQLMNKENDNDELLLLQQFSPLVMKEPTTIDFPNDVFDLPSSILEPPKTRPPPPPPPAAAASQESEAESSSTTTILSPSSSPVKPIRRMNSTKRIIKEIHSKRSSFLGLDNDLDLFDPDQMIEEPPDIRAFLQKEQKLKKSLFKKITDDGGGGAVTPRTITLSKVESQDSGLDIDRGRLSSDTWCSSSHERQDSEQTNSVTSEEDEIAKKERQIIEMIEKEEQQSTKDNNNMAKKNYLVINENELVSSKINNASSSSSGIYAEPTLGSDKFNNPYFPESSDHYLDDQDSEVLKVERELRQLEQEELERQRDNILFREHHNIRARLANRHSLENICDDIYPNYVNIDYRKSLPNLQDATATLEFTRPLQSTSSSSSYNNAANNNVSLSQSINYRQSTPDIQQAYRISNLNEKTGMFNNIIKSNNNNNNSNNLLVIDHRKSMPELQQHQNEVVVSRSSAFVAPTASVLQPLVVRQPIKPNTKPLRTISTVKSRILTKPSLKTLSAIPRNRHSDNWVTPKAQQQEGKNYSQHWVIQEAELRRLTDQQQLSSKPVAAIRNNWKCGNKQQQQEKPLPDSVIETITQRVQNRNNVNERNQPLLRNDLNKDYTHHPIYVNHPQTIGHAMPSVPFSSPPLNNIVDNNGLLQDRMLSVSGKKKCSYCNKELGRGAAMIIESLSLFYHMECFKCCVCQIQLGDGRIGTDVRVRNQKLHCHNCYSSDDGVKFSCV